MDRERWAKFSFREQLLFIGSELERARVWQEQNDKEKFRSALERALELIDLAIPTSQSAGNRYKMLWLRQALGESYLGQGVYGPGELYKAL